VNEAPETAPFSFTNIVLIILDWATCGSSRHRMYEVIMSKRDELVDTRSDGADDAPKSGFGVSRAPDGSRMRSPESMNTTKDSETPKAQKKEDDK